MKKLLTGERAMVTFTPETSGEYLIVIGENEGSVDFGGANLSVKQHGVAYDGLSSVSAVARKRIDCVGGAPVHVRLDGDASTNLLVGFYPFGSHVDAEAPAQAPSSSSSSSG